MSDNIILPMLRAIRADIAEMLAEQREHGDRLARIEVALAGIRRDQANDAENTAALWVRIDGLRHRIERIERRLELTDEPSP
jgi:hypothetical protein